MEKVKKHFFLSFYVIQILKRKNIISITILLFLFSLLNVNNPHSIDFEQSMPLSESIEPHPIIFANASSIVEIYEGESLYLEYHFYHCQNLNFDLKLNQSTYEFGSVTNESYHLSIHLDCSTFVTAPSQLVITLNTFNSTNSSITNYSFLLKIAKYDINWFLFMMENLTTIQKVGIGSTFMIIVGSYIFLHKSKKLSTPIRMTSSLLQLSQDPFLKVNISNDNFLLPKEQRRILNFIESRDSTPININDFSDQDFYKHLKNHFR